MKVVRNRGESVRAKVRLEYFIELDVEAPDKDDVYDWMMANTPQGVLDDMNKQGKANQIYEGYDEHIVHWYENYEDISVDLIIREE